MISNRINYIILEGPDLSGKTTFYNQFHKQTDYKWNIRDRSGISMLIYAQQYGRDTFRAVELLRQELYNLNNFVILLLPPWEVIKERYEKRGDEIQNLESLEYVYQKFQDAAEEFECYPNVIVIRKEVDEEIVKSIADQLDRFENESFKVLQKSTQSICLQSDTSECIGINFTHYDDGRFLDVNNLDLTYHKEVDYYDGIRKRLFDKLDNELEGNNEYNRKESLNSRRFIYTDDTCISLAHFLIRNDGLDCQFFLRSSNVKDTLYYDLNFLKSLARDVFNKFNLNNGENFCKMKFVINSAHII